MNLRLHHFLYAGVAVVAAVLLVSRLGGEERQVANKLGELTDLVAKEDPENALALAGRGRRLGALFSQDFVVALPPYGLEIRDRGTLARSFAAYRQGLEGIDAMWDNLDIAVADSKQAATVTADAVLSARGSDGRATGRERYRLAIELRQENRNWTIARLTLLEVVEGPERFF